MRSTVPSAHHPRRGRPRTGLLQGVAQIVDQAARADPGHVLVHVAGPVHPEVSIGLRSLDRGVHPFEVLAGFTAPADWSAFGICARGRARHLDEPHRPPSTTAMTFLVDREGDEAAVLRLGGDVSEPAGPAEGTIPDLCRRILDLPTAPAPPSTGSLWTTIWLDRVLEAWGQPQRRHQISSSWDQIARLHPCVGSREPTDGAELVAVARSHARATSWADLRTDPTSAPLPEGPVRADVARWMDDGFFARWTIGAFPSATTMVTDLRGLLGAPLGPRLAEVALTLLE